MGIIKYRLDASSPWVEIPALQGSKGADGKDGKDGATPVKGVDYFTEQEIDSIATQAAAKVEVPEVDLSGYALKEHEHEEYLTEHQDLSEYAKKTDIPEVPDVSGFQTETQVQALIDASLGVIENGTY